MTEIILTGVAALIAPILIIAITVKIRERNKERAEKIRDMVGL